MCTNTRNAQDDARRWAATAMGFLLLGIALATNGCGPPATTVTGVVTLEGQVLPEASVQFYPVNGKGQPVGTTTDNAGRYRAIVSPTPQRVVISKREVTGYLEDQTDLVDGGSPVVEERVPARYADVSTTPLLAEPVESEITTIDFPLTSAGK